MAENASCGNWWRDSIAKGLWGGTQIGLGIAGDVLEMQAEVPGLRGHSNLAKKMNLFLFVFNITRFALGSLSSRLKEE